MKRLLLITDINFWFQGSGDRSRILSLVQFLAQRTSLRVLFLGSPPAAIHGDDLNRHLGVEVVFLSQDGALSEKEAGEKIAQFCRTHAPDACIVEHIYLSYVLPYLPKRTTTLLDMHDVISARAEQFRQFDHSGKMLELSQETEVEILSAYDYVIAMCEPDRDVLAPWLEASSIVVAPHPARLTERPIRESVNSIAFIASNYLPNVDALVHFLSNVWLDFTEDGVQLDIYGAVSENLAPGVLALRNTVAHGYVFDLDPVYAHADIIINPVRFGAGLKIKNVEALANGLPLVTTSHGARGLESGSGSAFLMANTTAEWRQTLRALIGDYDRRRNLARNAFNFASAHFSPEACFTSLLNVIESN